MENKEYEKLGKECVEHLTKINPKGGIKEFVRMAVEFGYKKAEENHIKGNCFFGHKWGKWEQYEEDKYNAKYGIQHTEFRQRRYCLRCGKLESEKIY